MKPATHDPERLNQWLTGRGLRARELTPLPSGASPRSYWRAHLEHPLADGREHAIVMALPADALAPTEHGASARPGELSWLAMAGFLEALELPVPVRYASDLEAGYLLIEDLGDVRLYDRVREADPAAREALYEDAVALLARWQREIGDRRPSFGAPVFDSGHLLAELAEFRDMGLEARLGIQLAAAEREVLAEVGRTLVGELLSGPTLLAHRDFQSQNLMVTARGLVIIDFQDAFVAPDVYDLVALLRDSYIVLTPAEVDHHLARFARLVHRSADDLIDRFHLQTIQRKLKDAGRFETLARKGKPGFLEFFADSIGYVVHASKASGRFPELRELLLTRLPEAREAVAP